MVNTGEFKFTKISKIARKNPLEFYLKTDNYSIGQKYIYFTFFSK